MEGLPQRGGGTERYRGDTRTAARRCSSRGPPEPRGALRGSKAAPGPGGITALQCYEAATEPPPVPQGHARGRRGCGGPQTLSIPALGAPVPGCCRPGGSRYERGGGEGSDVRPPHANPGAPPPRGRPARSPAGGRPPGGPASRTARGGLRYRLLPPPPPPRGPAPRPARTLLKAKRSWRSRSRCGSAPCRRNRNFIMVGPAGLGSVPGGGGRGR